jgi:hypothetical protein
LAGVACNEHRPESFFQVTTLTRFDLGRESDKEIFGALVFPHTGCRMATLAGPAKTSAQVFVAPGDGLSRRLRKSAERQHHRVSVVVRGEIYFGRPAPSVADFDEPTVRWALGRSNEIAVWSSPYPDDSSALGEWMGGRALAGSVFQTLIETTPSRAVEWGQAVARWKKSDAMVRFFGPGGVQ